jgi:ubiquinone/menaquinone biosynthesis C-methylase UbiE
MTAEQADAEGWAAFATARDREISELRGTVLEIGAGDGANFASLHPHVSWIGLEPSDARRRQLAQKAARHGHHAAPLAAPAEQIPLPDASVDAVLATTVLCSVDDPGRVFDEVTRVLVPGGSLVLAEHVAAPPGSGARVLQRLVRPWTRLLDHGCDPVRDTEATLRNTRLRVESVQRFDVPVLGRVRVPFLVISARKPYDGA